MVIQKNLIAIIQARYNSIRFPGKVLKEINNQTLLEILIRRLNKSKYIDKIVVASSMALEDIKIQKVCEKLNVQFFQGAESDVIDRYYKVAKFLKAKNVIRITADCPYIDPKVIDTAIIKHFNSKADYTTNTMPPTYPDGYDVEIFKFSALKESWKVSRKKHYLKEHVTTFIRSNPKFNKSNVALKKDYSFLRLTIDDPIDLDLLKDIAKQFPNIYLFGVEDVIKLYEKNSNFFKKNIKTNRNQGLNMPLGQKFWKRAKNIIPGGSMLFSKNPDIFLPEKWPAYFSKTKGCKIWDLENNIFNDIAYMGVGTNTLGYNHPYVEEEVIKTIKSGTMSTLNSIEEILLAEKLISIHPWAEMVRFTRSGGEANAVAVRIARAASGKDKIAVCGYHGWHDWYLAANITNRSSLDRHLMKDLSIKGVPKHLKNSVFSFSYNNFEELKSIIEKNDIGVIKMEVKRDIEPKNNFLQKVRKLADKKNIVLIFDECTSGFRKTFGGLHKFYGVIPDVAIFGKALGNGYAINAIIGKRSVMESIKSTFVSSTFWTERIGPSAALATLKIMENIKSWEIISNIGNKISKNWRKIADGSNVKINIYGIEAIPNFSFESEYNLFFKTFITQEMLKNKILASNSVYCCIEHDDKVLSKYFDILNKLFLKIKIMQNNKINMNNFLNSPVCISGFREIK
jgi:glutamate-1-semialdehyde aminotransferase/spore coat polysaccharide biosynthesis protein SpsF (cytidylyltransferase family)